MFTLIKILGILFFSIHFRWLFLLLIEHSCATWLMSFLIYIFFVSYFSISWLLFVSLLKKVSSFVKSISFKIIISSTLFCLYLVFLDRLILYPIFPGQRYPLCSPIIFLMPDKTESETDIAFLRPEPEEERGDVLCLAQKIAQQLSSLKMSSIKNKIILAPESTFPFPLNEYPQIVRWWSLSMAKDVHLLIGAQRSELGKFYQTVYWIHGGRIIEVYDKLAPLPIAEEKSNNEIWSNLFLKNKNSISSGRQTKIFDLGFIKIVPQICSDLLNDNLPALDSSTFICYFMNDSWFPDYFKQLLKKYLILKTLLSKAPAIYITHDDIFCYHDKPKSKIQNC